MVTFVNLIVDFRLSVTTVLLYHSGTMAPNPPTFLLPRTWSPKLYILFKKNTD